MLLATRWALIPAVLAGCLLAAAPADAATPEVRDQANMFSAEAIKKANTVIADIKQTHGKDVVVETYATVPDGKAEQVRNMTREARNQFFRDWLAERARALKADGVFILICKDPANLQVEQGRETAKKLFPEANEKELSRLLLRKFEARKYDEGLLESVDYIKDTMRANSKASAAPAGRTSSPPATAAHNKEGGGYSWGGLICMGLLILGGIWLVVGLIRAFTGGWGGGGGGYGPGYGGYGMGGGGFFSSLMGGLFGAAAGMYLYNNFFGGGSSWGSQAHGSESSPSASDEGQGFNDASGGDFGGDDSAGGDWGGGDSGGDWGGGGGGGDWGGGGDFGGGGGGGDW